MVQTCRNLMRCGGGDCNIAMPPHLAPYWSYRPLPLNHILPSGLQRRFPPRLAAVYALPSENEMQTVVEPSSGKSMVRRKQHCAMDYVACGCESLDAGCNLHKGGRDPAMQSFPR